MLREKVSNGIRKFFSEDEFTMSVKCFLKCFAIAIGIQMALLVLSLFIYYLGGFLYVYWPWVQLVEYLTGANGGHAMAGTAIIGWLVGMIFHSLLAGIVICFFKGRRRIS